MDTFEKSRRPWWRRRSWRLAIALWLLMPVLYVAAHGPVAYCAGREWLPPSFYRTLYWPYFAFYERYPKPPEPAKSYRLWHETTWFIPAIDARAAEKDREVRATWEREKRAKHD